MQISGKNLGQLALKSFCPRCFWLRMHNKGRLPYQIFPGIFSSIDSYTKKITAAHFANHGRLPDWLESLGDELTPVPVPHHSTFRHEDSATRIRLTGAPDDIFRAKDGAYVIVDYKTARHSKHQDTLSPMYRIQLNAYAWIGERIGLDPVRSVALIYYEPMTDLTDAEFEERTTSGAMAMGFDPKVVPIRLDPEAMVRPLLERARSIYDESAPPVGLAGCEDCKQLASMIALSTGTPINDPPPDEGLFDDPSSTPF